MTLILTILTPHGIAMAADSAVTYENAVTKFAFARPNQAKKLHIIPYLHAGISCWGLGKIGNKTTDAWLSDVISANAGQKDIRSFAEELASRLNRELSSNHTDRARVGFHLAGFEDFEGSPTPSFFHIHDGASTTLAARGIRVDPARFNANHDWPPAEYKKYERNWPITRNGDIQLYAGMFDRLDVFFAQIKAQDGIVFPSISNLEGLKDYLVFQIRTVANIYRLSNLVPGIGGRIDYVTIAPSGISSVGKED